ncbi:MAG: aldehyde dehydrogenase family protein [Gammaproteobacteria bacterium]
MKKIVSQYINGIYVETQQAARALYNPATGEQIKQITYASEAEVNEAIHTAQIAFETWSETRVDTRLQLLTTFEQVIQRERNDLAKIIMEEEGKSFSAAQMDLQNLLSYLRYTLTASSLFAKRTFSERQREKREEFSPLGVTGMIGTPEFPALTNFWLVPIALLLGNVCIVKATEVAPSVILKLAEILTQIGLPNGVLNVIQGDHLVSEHLIRASGVQAITSIATSSVFLEHMQLAHLTGKKIQQIMRPWSLSVVLEDACIDRVVEEIAQSMLVVPQSFSASVSIQNASSVLAVGDVADKIVPRLKARLGQFKLGPAQENEIAIGPLSSEQHLHQMRKCIDRAVTEGARVVLDGRRSYVRGYENGYYMSSTLLDHVNQNMSTFKEDLMAPILNVHRVPDLDEASTLLHQVTRPSMAEPSSSLRSLQATVAIYSENYDLARQFAWSLPTTLLSINEKSTKHYLAQSGGRAIVLDPELRSMEAYSKAFFSRYKVININWSELKDDSENENRCTQRN